MDEHSEIRELLTLAAAGALDAGEQRRVEDHLRQCSGCRAEFAAWQRLTGALEDAPTPQAPSGLVERTRRQMEMQAVRRAEHRRNNNLLVWLIALAWASTVASWLGFRWIDEGLAQTLNVSVSHLSAGWIAYTLLAWVGTAVVVVMLGNRYQHERRTA